MGTFDAAGRNVEVAFCFDTTGSMYSCLDTVSLHEVVSSESTCHNYVKCYNSQMKSRGKFQIPGKGTIF